MFMDYNLDILHHISTEIKNVCLHGSYALWKLKLISREPNDIDLLFVCEKSYENLWTNYNNIIDFCRKYNIKFENSGNIYWIFSENEKDIQIIFPKIINKTDVVDFNGVKIISIELLIIEKMTQILSLMYKNEYFNNKHNEKLKQSVDDLSNILSKKDLDVGSISFIKFKEHIINNLSFDLFTTEIPYLIYIDKILKFLEDYPNYKKIWKLFDFIKNSDEYDDLNCNMLKIFDIKKIIIKSIEEVKTHKDEMFVMGTYFITDNYLFINKILIQFFINCEFNNIKVSTNIKISKFNNEYYFDLMDAIDW